MAERLPAAAWTQREDLGVLVGALDPAGEGNCRYVGGAVRDTLLGQEPHDVDLATALLPEAVIARLSGAGIRAVPTGIAHGTVTAVLAGGPVEITTLRRDVSTDGRHATIAFSTDWREDAARRDFTINALYAEPITLDLHDYFGGLADLAAQQVRFIGSAEARVREDYLRILRYFRFQARFGSEPADGEAEAACRRLAPGLKGLSRERVGWELMALLALPDPAPTVARMAELGVLEQVLPEADPAPLAALIGAERHAGAAPDPLRRLAALLPAEPTTAEQVGSRLRLSNARRKRLALAADRGGTVGNPRALAYRIGLEPTRDRLLLAGDDVAPLAGWEPPSFPLKGRDVVKRGIAAGPEVARLLNAAEACWIAEGFPDAARAAALLDEAIALEG